MNLKDRIKFVKMVANNKTQNSFQAYLGFSPRDVARHKKELGIETPEQARALLRKWETNDTLTIQRHQELNKEYQERQNRLDQIQQQPKIKKKVVKRKKRVNIKIQQERLDKMEAKNLPVSNWRLPEETSQEEFIRLLKHYGWRVTASKFGVSRNDLLAEICRLKLDLNPDMIRR